MGRGKIGGDDLGLGSSEEGRESVGMGTVCGTPDSPRAGGGYLEVEGGRRWERAGVEVGGSREQSCSFCFVACGKIMSLAWPIERNKVY